MTAVLACRDVRKRYGGVRALDGVGLEVRPGEVQAIVGENGAGKSTLMKILAGAEQPDSGTVLVDGEPVALTDVGDGIRHGIAIVFQELSLFPHLDVLANLFLGREPRRLLGLVDRRTMAAQVRPLLDELGLHVDLSAPVEQLRLGERQLVEIARALSVDARVLILDEPNSALNAAESERLFAVVRALRARGVAIVYVSHRLEEVFAIADVITVVRNGAITWTRPTATCRMDEVIAAMIGRDPATRAVAPSAPPPDGPRLELDRVSVDGRLREVSFTARAGELVGLAGLEGAGVQTVFAVLFGLQPLDGGRVVLPSGRPAPRSVPDAVRQGIAYVPADRRTLGLMLDADVLSNLVEVTAGALGRHGFRLRRRELLGRAQEQVDALRIRTSSLLAPVQHLSGGNQQKVVLGKWLAADPSLVLLDDPGRGVDVGAKEEIFRVARRLVDDGRVVLMTSSELLELVLCDRVLVLYRGRLVGELRGNDLTEHGLLEAINTGFVGPPAQPAPSQP